MKPNKIIFGEEVLIDLTEDTVNADKMIEGATAHDSSGEIIEGIIPVIENEEPIIFSEKDQSYTIEKGYHPNDRSIQLDQTTQENTIPENIKVGIDILGVTGTFTSDGDVTSDDILFGKIAYSKGEKVEGVIPIYPTDSSEATTIIRKNTPSIEIEQGYHDGTESIQLDQTTQENTIPENIKVGIDILGVTGTFTSDGTIEPSDILEGKVGYANGNRIEGTCTFDADTSDGDAEPIDLAFGKTAYVKGKKITGIAPSNLQIQVEENEFGTTFAITSEEIIETEPEEDYI